MWKLARPSRAKREMKVVSGGGTSTYKLCRNVPCLAQLKRQLVEYSKRALSEHLMQFIARSTNPINI